MDIITLDFETFYGPGYTLSSMTTEDYVRDPRFDTMLVSVKFGKGYTKWFSGTVKQTGDWLRQFDIPNNALLCHNMSFDGLILQHHYGIVPKLYLDTRLMGQAIVKPWTGSASLKSCLEHENIGFKKGDDVVNMYGRPRASLSKQELEKYASYCHIRIISGVERRLPTRGAGGHRPDPAYVSGAAVRARPRATR